MNKQEAARIIALAVVVMPNLQDKSIAKTAAAWASIMPDVSYKQGEAAMLKLLRERSIPTLPLPGEILAALKELKTGFGQKAAPLDFEAWQEVCSKIDPYKAVTHWSHPAIGQAVQFIGSRNICGGDRGTADRFMRVYNSIVKRNGEREENKTVLSITCSDGKNLLEQISEKRKSTAAD